MSFICNDCPRQCNVTRSSDKPSGYCRSYSLPAVVRAAPHFGEEPCISGTRGSGAVFFSGCSLKCVFCQNNTINASGDIGRVVDAEKLRDIFFRLRDTGVHNINLVTASHHTRVIARALDGIELGIPVIWNSSGYELPDTLKRLEGLVQIYMPDLKFMKSEIAQKYCNAPDYPETAANAILEMYRQTGPYHIDSEGIMQSGVLIRHLLMPEQPDNSMYAIDFVSENFPEDSVLFSLMSQYTPVCKDERFPELLHRVSPEICNNLKIYMEKRHISNGYWQEPSSAVSDYIPAFDMTGIDQ